MAQTAPAAPGATTGAAASSEPAGVAAAQYPDEDAAALWEALDRGVDLTDTGAAAEAVGAPARGEEQ